MCHSLLMPTRSRLRPVRPCMMTQLRWRLVFPQRKRESEKGRHGGRQRGPAREGRRTQFLPHRSSHPPRSRPTRRLLLFAPLLPSHSSSSPSFSLLPSPLPLSIYPLIRSPDSLAPRGRRLPSSLRPSPTPSLSPCVFNDSRREGEMKS